jgi:hypothetical protein
MDHSREQKRPAQPKSSGPFDMGYGAVLGGSPGSVSQSERYLSFPITLTEYITLSLIKTVI